MSSEEPIAGDDSAQTASTRQPATAPVKCAYVCPNGSRYGKVRKVVIPSRLRQRWEGVLQLVDDSIPIFGGCFNLVKVGDNGEYSKVTEFDEIEDNELYVAMNQSEKLIKMDYKGLLNNSRSPSPPRRSQQSTASRKPRQKRQNEAESKFQKYLPRIIIRVYANDIYNKPPQRATLEQAEVYERRANVFKNKIVSAMDFVFQDIEDSSGMTLKGNQSIKKMVDVRNGKVVEAPNEIESGQIYVMCGGEDYREFVQHGRIVRPFQCGKFSHERQRFLNNPRSAKVKGGNSSRKQKGQDTARDTAREEKTDRSGRTSDNRRSNGYESQQGYNSREYEDPYAQDTSRQNGYHEENGDEFSQRQEQHEEEDDEYNNIPRFGEADAPLLTDRKTSNQDEKNEKEEERPTEESEEKKDDNEKEEKPTEETSEKKEEGEKSVEEVAEKKEDGQETSQAAEQNDSANEQEASQPSETYQNNDAQEANDTNNGFETNDQPFDDQQNGQATQ